MDNCKGTERERPKAILREWLYISLLALSFLLYGLIMFFAIGDKGSPDWDFGTLPDTPGQSVYSTHPEIGGQAPAPQHIAGRPSEAPAVQGEGK